MRALRRVMNNVPHKVPVEMFANKDGRLDKGGVERCCFASSALRTCIVRRVQYAT